MSLSQFLKSKLGAFFIILPYIKPASEITGVFNGVFNLWKMVSAGFIFVCCFRKKEKISELPIWCLFLIQVIYFISTCFNLADIKSAMVQLISNISILIYLVWLYNEDEYLAIRNFMYPTLFMALLTVFTMFVFYPDGMYQVSDGNYTEKSNYLWGFDNTSGMLFVSTMFFLAIHSMYVNKKRTYLKTLAVMIIFFAAFLYVDAKTTYLMMFFIIIGYVAIIYYKLRLKSLNPRVIISIIVVLFVFVIFFNSKFIGVWNYLKKIGKYYSIKARFNFFDLEFQYIAKSPLWGCGIEEKLLSAKKLYIDHPHNYFMDLLYHGGIFALVSMGLFFFEMIRGKKIKDSISIMAGCFLATTLIIVMLDFYNEMYLFYPQMAMTFLLLKNRKYILHKKEINSGSRK